MTDPWTDPADALFTNPDWEDPFPYEEGWPVELAGPEYSLSWTDDSYSDIRQLGWPIHDFYTPRARFVSDRE